MTNILLLAQAFNLELERIFNEKYAILKNEANSIYLEIDTILKSDSKKIVFNNSLAVEKDLVNFRDLLIKLILEDTNHDNFPKEIEVKPLLLTKYSKFGEAYKEIMKIVEISSLDTKNIQEKLGI